MIKKIPHTFVMIFYLTVIAAVLTWIIPGGHYTEETVTVNGIAQKQLVFHYTENVKQWWQVFASLYNGFVKQAGIIVFIMLIGGAFWIMNSSRAIDVGINTFINRARKVAHYRIFRKTGIEPFILAFVWIVFSVFGAVFGMSEETIAFVIMLVPLAIKMGYDSITGVSMVYVAAAVGFAGAILNPFTIGVAQGIAGLPLFSGIEYRSLCWLVINITSLIIFLRYASKIKKNPHRSTVYEIDSYWRKHHPEGQGNPEYHTPRRAWYVFFLISLVLIVFSIQHTTTALNFGDIASARFPLMPVLTALFIIAGVFSLRKSVHFFLLQLLLFTILFLIAGVMGYQWYIMEIATLFLAMGIFAGLAMKKSPDELVKLFLEGIRDILPAALVVGLARGITVILEDGQVIDTILYSLSESMHGLNNITTIGAMYLFQSCINLVVVSGSAQAALTMPIFAPLSDLIGLSRQAAVLVYQFGDGFTNMITPASAVLMGVLGIARIPYEKWVRWVFPLVMILIVVGFLLLIPTVTMEIRGF
ncbi:MAG: YfcC family protein [Bacteroidales bacterium]|nr:YfcC family protein [Bacteroidales bacterium]